MLSKSTFQILVPGLSPKAFPLIDRHPAWDGRVREVGHLHHVWLFLIALYLPARNIWLESFSEVRGAHDSVDNCEYN